MSAFTVSPPAFMHARASPSVTGGRVASAAKRPHSAAHGSVVCAAAAAPEVGKIRIKLRSYEHKSLGEAVTAIIAAANTTGAKVAGPIPLPTRRRLYCVLRSPHVNKNSMEHFQLLTHQRLIDVKNPSAQTIDALMQLDMPAGVDIEVKL